MSGNQCSGTRFFYKMSFCYFQTCAFIVDVKEIAFAELPKLLLQYFRNVPSFHNGKKHSFCVEIPEQAFLFLEVLIFLLLGMFMAQVWRN